VIRVAKSVEGAVHVTACHELELYAACHQLRMHESTILKCHVTVGSGPILEDCSGIVFYAANTEDVVYDAKDFNWLRNGVPSPNFSIIKESMNEKTIQHSVGPCTVHEEGVGKSTSFQRAEQDNVDAAVSEEAQFDEDDEL